MFLIPMEIVIGTEFLAIILSAGTAAMIGAVVQAYRSLKEGSRADDRDALAELESSRTRERDRADNAETDRDYWRNRAGGLEFVLVSRLGADALPAGPTLEEWREKNRKHEDKPSTS